jgi:hypothetical protein
LKHNVDDRIKWCYVAKTLPVEYSKLAPEAESTQTGTHNSTQTQDPDLNLNSKMEWTGGDLNPRPPECKCHTSEISWEKFGSWLFKTHTRRNAKEMLRYAQRFAIVLEKPNMASQLLLLNKDLRRVVMSALSNLSKFLGVYEHWKYTIRNYGLKWENTSSLEAFLSILNSNLEETEEWLRQVIKKLPKEYSTVLVFDALTGLRPTEAALSCKLISELSQQNKLNSYLDRDLIMLQHFRFPDLFLRKSKNAYISFITPRLLNLYLKQSPTSNTVE